MINNNLSWSGSINTLYQVQTRWLIPRIQTTVGSQFLFGPLGTIRWEVALVNKKYFQKEKIIENHFNIPGVLSLSNINLISAKRPQIQNKSLSYGIERNRLSIPFPFFLWMKTVFGKKWSKQEEDDEGLISYILHIMIVSKD